MYDEKSANAPLMNQMRDDSKKFNYPRMKVIPIRIVSSICVILGILSISVQVQKYLYKTRISMIACRLEFLVLKGHRLLESAESYR